MNLAVSFLDGYVDSINRCADCERFAWDEDYREGYMQRIEDEDAELAEWGSEAPAHSDLIYNADHRARIEKYLCDVDNPTVHDLQMMYMADNASEEPGYRQSWHTF